MRTIVIKLGSSIVARADGELRADVLARICDAVAGLHRAGEECVLVSSGAIARGVRVMGLPARPTAIGELQAASAVGQGKLYRAYDELLRERELTSAQVLLTASDLAARAQYLNARHTLRTLLDWRVLAVVNENDTTATDEISFGDNDFLAAQVAMLVSADLLVLLTDIDGLHSADPRIDPTATLIEDVHGIEELRGLDIGDSTSPLGSGGMRSKVLAAEIAGAAGIPAVICNGVRAGDLEAVLAGERAGTRFHPGPARHSSFKLWLRYAKPSHGTLIVDAGAARALREQGTSLLPVGIVDVQGDFDAGDAVEIVQVGAPQGTQAGRGEGASGGQSVTDEVAADGGARGSAAGRVLAKGICNYSAAELRRVKGLKSDAVRELLPHASEEAVHRDQMVLA
jgi:glutamate 5-kinase